MSERPRTAEQAERNGWAVDRTTYPWTAYRGSRFMPDDSCQIETPAWTFDRCTSEAAL